MSRAIRLGESFVVKTSILVMPALLSQPVHAQSVLESVLAEIEIAQETLLPLLATNLAINTGWSSRQTTLATADEDAIVAILRGEFFDPSTNTTGTLEIAIEKSDLGSVLTRAETLFYEDIFVSADGTIYVVDTDGFADMFLVLDPSGAPVGGTGLLPDSGIAAALQLIPQDAAVYTNGSDQFILSAAVASQYDFLELSFDDVYNDFGIDASITNRISGSVESTLASIGNVSAMAVNVPTVDLGNLSTTGLGAVNTGEIMLGVSSALDQAVGEDVNALSGRIQSLGTTFGEMALVWNGAYNDMTVDGSINTVVQEVNMVVGNASTTVLGAVNTGEIVSGVGATIRGIVGVSGAN